MPIRVYADTSVFGGVFDPEFQKPSRTFFEQVRQGRFQLVISDTVDEEIIRAPLQVRAWYEQHLPYAEAVLVDDAAAALRDAYLKAGIVTPQWAADAEHVATASVQRCRLIVSWNFKHIVHFDKIPLYNGVNLIHGYDNLSINSPAEVIDYED
ncbi:MAG: hypothetical protein R3F23_09055 [Verrucomicrobiia bacterium]